jgi:hypothetical protein
MVDTLKAPFVRIYHYRNDGKGGITFDKTSIFLVGNKLVPSDPNDRILKMILSNLIYVRYWNTHECRPIDPKTDPKDFFYHLARQYSGSRVRVTMPIVEL